MSVGSNHTCGVTTGAIAYCWGQGGFGQLGDGSVDSSVFNFQTTPIAVSGGLMFASVSAVWIVPAWNQVRVPAMVPTAA